MYPPSPIFLHVDNANGKISFANQRPLRQEQQILVLERVSALHRRIMMPNINYLGHWAGDEASAE